MLAELVPIVEKLQSRVDTGRILLEFPSGNHINIVPTAEDTFPIWAIFEDSLYHVGAAKWSTQFDTADQASTLIRWLLTPYYRILRSVKDGVDLATWIEIYTDQGWEGTEFNYFTESGDGESPVEGADEISILQQAVFLDSAFTTHYPASHLDQAGYPVGTILGATKYESRYGEWHPVGIPSAE